jgi:predicted SAM-dependent methyltransferase
MRSVLSYQKVRFCIAQIIRNRQAFMNLKVPSLILNVGCGQNTSAQDINLDYDWFPGIDVCCDIRKGLPFQDGYVGGIFTEHCIEHICFNEALFVFDEFHRVMSAGACIRIIVPDLEIYIDRYREFHSNGSLNFYQGEGSSLRSPAVSINRLFRGHGHQFIYDFPTLQAMLDQTGFVSIKKMKFGDSQDTRLLLDTPSRQIESLYVEAKKPQSASLGLGK